MTRVRKCNVQIQTSNLQIPYLPEWEAGTLLIQPPRLVSVVVIELSTFDVSHLAWLTLPARTQNNNKSNNNTNSQARQLLFFFFNVARFYGSDEYLLELRCAMVRFWRQLWDTKTECGHEQVHPYFRSGFTYLFIHPLIYSRLHALSIFTHSKCTVIIT